MTSQDGFTKMEVAGFKNWIQQQNPQRTISRLQVHHTAVPSYKDFNGSNHFAKQSAIRRYHVETKGWSDIAYHLVIYPDGAIITGRNLHDIPAGISGQNTGSIAIAAIGNFDNGQDSMNMAQKAAIVEVYAILCKRFALTPNEDAIIYHSWYANKSCPGTNFFTGNTRASARMGFYPLVADAMQGTGSEAEVQQHDESNVLTTAVNDASSYITDKMEGIFATVAFWNDGTEDADSNQVTKTEKAGIIFGFSLGLYAFYRLLKS